MRKDLNELLILALGLVVGIAMIASPILHWVYGG